MEVIRQHLHVCVKELRVKIRISGVARTGLDGEARIVTSGREVTARAIVAQHGVEAHAATLVGGG